MVQGIDARCGTFVVPENRATPKGRMVGLNVVILPAFAAPARKDAVAFLDGGPGAAATDETAERSEQLSALNMNRDILLVDSARHREIDTARRRRRGPLDDGATGVDAAA